MFSDCVWTQKGVVLQQEFLAVSDLHVALDEVFLRRFVQRAVFLVLELLAIGLLLFVLIRILVLAELLVLLAVEPGEDVVVLLRADVFLLRVQQIPDELVELLPERLGLDLLGGE